MQSFTTDSFPPLSLVSRRRGRRAGNMDLTLASDSGSADKAENLILALGTHPRLAFSTVVEYGAPFRLSVPAPVEQVCPLPETEVVFGCDPRPPYSPHEASLFKEEVRKGCAWFKPLDPKKVYYLSAWASMPGLPWWQEKYLLYIRRLVLKQQQEAYKVRKARRERNIPVLTALGIFLETGMEVDTGRTPFGPENLLPCCRHECNRRLQALGLAEACLYERVHVRARKTTPREQVVYGPFPQVEEPWELVRSPVLLARLRALRREMRARCCSYAVASYYVGRVAEPARPTMECGAPQMEGADGEELSSIKTGNVVLTEENPSAPAVASNKTFDFKWHKLCSAEKETDYSYLTDRFTLFKTFEWKVGEASNYEKTECAMHMPVDFVDSVKNKPGTMPMFLPFKIHRYCKTDIEFKFHINSNKFQVGQLQFSWQYLEQYDGNPLDNIWSRSQLPNVLVNAGASNEATLYVPFKYVQPYLHTSQRPHDLLRLYLGTLRCFVVVPLAVGPLGPQTCSVSVFVRFPSCSFSGMTDGSIGDPQMEEAAAMMVAGAVVNKFIGDRNCDNPSVNVNPNFLVPTGSHSWCAGTGLSEQVMSLRLDNSVRGVGRSGIDLSETSVGIPCRTFSMLKHFTWSIVDAGKNISGYQLFSCDVHPQFEKDKFYKVVPDGGFDCYALPPVTVVSSLYKQWRGSLEFKFDIIASQFHTGRLLCAYLPGFYGNSSNVTIDMARNCPHVEFSLQDATSFTFKVPYIANSVFWPRKYSGPHKYNNKSSPSKLVMYILNPLIPMESIVDKVTIVPYVRAGEDFEVSVPVQPGIGLSDNPQTSISLKDMIYPTQGSYPFRLTNSNQFGDSKKYICYEGTDTFGTVSTFHAPERKLQEKEYYYGIANHVSNFPIFKFTNPATNKVDRAYMGFIVLLGTPSGNLGIPFPAGNWGEAQAKKVAKQFRQGKPMDQILPNCIDYIEDSENSSSPDISKLRFEPRYNVLPDKINSISECAYPEIETRFDAPNLLDPVGNLPSTSSGRFNYNESFNDLKDLCRRYQLYAEKDLEITPSFVSGNTIAICPVIPSGLPLDIDKYSSVFNVSRDGHIPIVCSGYIYFRGSIRFKLVVTIPNSLSSTSKIWVQHHPDVDCDADKLEVWPNIDDEDGFKSHSYGFYVQNANINTILEFEVPFYQPGMYGLTRKKSSMSNARDVCQYYNLGSLLIGLTTSAVSVNTPVNIQLYYSVGDDFSLSTFRGFPQMIFTDNVWPEDKKKIRYRVTESADPEMEHGDPEMLNSVKKYIKNAIIGTVTEASGEIASSVVKSVKDNIDKAWTEAKEKYVMEKEYRTPFALNIDSQTLTNAFGNLLHVLANPTVKTVAISVANVLMAMLSADIVSLVRMIECVYNVLKTHWARFTEPDKSGAPQGDTLEDKFSEKSILSLCGLVFTGISTVFGVSCLGPKQFPDILKHINSTVGLTNNVIRLIQNCSELITYCFRWCVAKVYPEARLKMQMCNDVPEIKAWYDECTYLLDVRNKSSFLYDKRMMDRVMYAAMTGSILVSNGLNKSSPGGKVIFDTHKEIRKMQVDLFERGVHPDVRFEAFPIWLSGEAGIGKSYLVKQLCRDILTSVKLKHRGSMIYDIAPGAKYWTGCENPAALVSDDIFQVQGQIFEQELSTLFAVCSSSVLNPPMAAVEQKERRINPYLYIMLCNHHFPNLEPTCRTPEAIYRRRKFLISARIKPSLREEYPDLLDASDLPPHIVKTLDHLEFQLAKNPRDKETGYTSWMSYTQLLDLIKARFARHFEAEKENFKKRMCDMYCLDDNFEETNVIEEIPELQDKLSLQEQIAFFKEHIAEKLDALEDPSADKDAWYWIRMFCDRTWMKKDTEKKPDIESGNAQSEDPPSSSSSNADVESLKEEYVQKMKDGATLTELFNGVMDVYKVQDQSAKIAECRDELEHHFPNFAKWIGVENVANHMHILNAHPLIQTTFGNRRCDLYSMHAKFMGRLSNGEQNELRRGAQKACHKIWLGVAGTGEEPVDDPRWSASVLKEIFDHNSIDTIDYLKFLAQYPGGAAIVAHLIYGNLDRWTFPFSQDIREEYASMPDVSNLGFLDAVKQTSKYVTGQRLTLKDGLRQALRKVPYIKNSEAYTTFLVACEDMFAESVDEPYRGIIRECVFKYPHWESGLLNKNTAIDLVYKMYDHVYKYLLDIVTEPVHKVKILTYCLNMYSCILLAGSMFDAGHVCSARQDYMKASLCPSAIKYCSIYKEISFQDKVIDTCGHTCCMYSSNIQHFILTLACSSHTKGYMVMSKEDREYFETGVVAEYEYTDVREMIRNRLKSSRRRRFDRIILWLKDFTFHTLPNWISKAFQFLYSQLPKILAIVVAFFALRFLGRTFGLLDDPNSEVNKAARLYKNLKQMEGVFQEASGKPEGNYFKFDTPRAPKKTGNPHAAKTFGTPQMCTAARETIAKRIEGNTVILYCHWEEEGTSHVRKCHNLMIRGHAMLTLRHFYEEYQAIVDSKQNVKFNLFFKRNNSADKISVTWKELTDNVAWCSDDSEVLTSNFGIVILPRRLPMFKDLVRNFAPKSNIDNPPSLGDMYVVNGTSSFGMNVSVVNGFRVNAGQFSSEVYCPSVFKYNMQFAGMCGSALVFPNLNSGSGAIGGVHIAGNDSTGKGYSEPVWREMFEKFFGEFPEVVPIETEFLPIENADVKLEGNMLMYGCVPREFAHTESGRTRIVPSLLHGEIYPVKTEVNPLKPNDPRQPPGSHPLRDGCSKHGSGNVIEFETEDVDIVTEHLTDRFRQIVQPIRTQVAPLSMQQAVCGDPNIPHFEPLNWKSSEGFPLSSKRPSSAHDKKWLFNLEQGQFGYTLKGIHPELQKQLALRKQCFEQNLHPFTIYTDCLKDYRLSPQKCKIPGKTRIFSIAPVQCSIDIRTYLGDFTASIKNSRIQNSIAIGINPDSIEWTTLVHYLVEAMDDKDNPCIITLDYSNYGPTLMSQLVHAGNKVITNWHEKHGASEEHVKRVNWLLNCDILNPIHLCSNVVYQTFNGISSGSPLTGECNSIPNIYYIRLVYLEIMRRHMPELANMFYFDSLVRLVVYGDDLIMCVNESIVSVFNACTIRDYLFQHGIKVTSAQKDQELKPFTSLSEATFLKRSFKPHPSRPGIWLGPVDLTSVEECVNWIHKCEDTREATLECCRASLDLAYSHGPDYYHAHCERIVKELVQKGLTLSFKSWKLRDDEIFENPSIHAIDSDIKIDLPWTYDLKNHTLI